MPLFLTPGLLAQRGEFYLQLSSLVSAGVTIITAFEHLQKHPTGREFLPVLGQVLTGLRTGDTVARAFQSCGPRVSEFELALIEAGEKSGRLDASFRLLAEYYQDRARMARQVLSDLAYPMAVLHLAVFLLPFAEFFTSGNFLRYGAKTLGILLPLYGVAIAGLYALQAHHNEIWRARLEQWLDRVPVLGKARRSLALARLCAALEALVNAGVDILPAWQMAADASGSPALRRTIRGWMPDLSSGRKTPAEAVSGSAEFPSLFAGQYHAGEMAGRVDETLRHLHGYYQEEAKRLFHILAAWMPRGFYFGVILLVAWKVVQFWLGYFDQINNIMK